MASLRADATALSGKVGATVDLGFGRRAEEFSYNDGAANGFLSLSNIKQAYLTYAPSSKVKFTAGKFATHVGYELLDAPLNRNYSMSYMFTNGPFFHTGLKADITAGPIGFMLGLTNYTDETTATTTTKNLIAQVSDAVILGTISSKFNIGYNGTVQSRKPVTGSSGSWIGNALYLNFDPTDKVGITLRSELISDSKTIYFTTKSIFANTISVNAKVGPLTIVPELRFESAQSNFYLKNDGSGTKSTVSALVAAVYKF
jgi:hypothetical protein